MLATHDHAGVTTDALLRQVWGRRGSDDTNRVRTVVKKLRAWLGDDASVGRCVRAPKSEQAEDLVNDRVGAAPVPGPSVDAAVFLPVPPLTYRPLVIAEESRVGVGRHTGGHPRDLGQREELTTNC